LATIYVETSIIGYLTARSQQQVIFVARQELTRNWWNHFRQNYELVASELVLTEAGRGDPVAAAERLEYLQDIDLLDMTDQRIELLVDALLKKSLLPEKARSDAFHVATATVHQVNYLMTWNCRHIANADQLPKVYQLLADHGYTPPLIVTPEEFSGNE